MEMYEMFEGYQFPLQINVRCQSKKVVIIFQNDIA